MSRNRAAQLPRGSVEAQASVEHIPRRAKDSRDLPGELLRISEYGDNADIGDVPGFRGVNCLFCPRGQLGDSANLQVLQRSVGRIFEELHIFAVTQTEKFVGVILAVLNARSFSN